MGYFSEMALNKQEELGLPAEQVSAGNAFEDEETFDELPVPSASHSAASPTVETPSSPAFDADDGAEELAEMNGDDASEAADTDGEDAGKEQEAPAKADATTDADEEKRRAELKKSALLAMPKLTATPEMKQAAIADEPKQHEGPYGYRYVERTYYPYMNCVVQDGILKAAFYLPEHLRLDGNNPAYEVFLDKKAHQFLTYDHLEKKWRDAKLDRLNWPGRNYYATCWASEKDAAVVQDYLCGERGGDLGILDFQRNVRDEQLEQRHKRITGAWDQDLAQVPELPKDWMRWIDKVAVRENFIFYRYKRGGAQNGYCTFCGKEVPISGHPYHNKKGRCACCRHPIVFKALGRAGYIRTEKDYAYLIQRCKDGFVLREFWAERTYWKDSLPSGKPYWHEFRRSIYDRSGEIRSYYWGVYCQRETRWISGNPCYYSYCGNQTGRVYGKSLPCMEQKELFGTGLVQWIRTHPVTDPEKYLAVWKRMPKMEQIWKADLPRLTKECFEHCDSVRERILYPNETRLIRALGLDGPKFRRLRQINGDTEDLAWLQLEKRTNQRIPDELFRWFKKERISAKDILFIADRMSPIQIRNYLQKQKPYFDGSCRQALTTWQDYLAMAERLHIDTSDEIIYRARKLRQRHDELVIQCEAGSLELQAENMDKKYPHVRSICEELQKKYAYADEDYLVIAPQNTFDIIKEGRMLHHCVGNDGAGERYYDRIERRESFIMFLRRAEEPEDPYYTLEIEPDGTVRQKRTLFDRQHEDIEQATEFLQKWQKVIAARLTGQDLKLAAQSRVLRNEEFIQMKKDRVVIHTGHLAGHLLADVLLADLMENKEIVQQQELPAAA